MHVTGTVGTVTPIIWYKTRTFVNTVMEVEPQQCGEFI